MIRTLLLTLFVLTGSARAQSSILDGVYMGLRQSGITGAIYQDYWTFRPDGVVIDDYPTEGLDRPLDVERTCALYPCGTYSRTGSTLRIHWAYEDSPRNYTLDAEGAFNELGKTSKYRPLRFLDGVLLDGTFAVDNPESGGTLVALTLTADGRFQETNLMGWTSWAQLGPPEEHREALPGGKGTYTINRNTLALQYEGGLTAYFFVVVPPGEADVPTTRVLYVNTASLDRRAATAVEPPAKSAANLRVALPYPSPSNTYSTLRVTVVTPQQIRVAVCTLLGQEMQVAFDGLARPGEPTLVPLHTEGLPAGSYLVQVRSEQGRLTRLLTVVH